MNLRFQSNCSWFRWAPSFVRNEIYFADNADMDESNVVKMKRIKLMFKLLKCWKSRRLAVACFEIFNLRKKMIREIRIFIARLLERTFNNWSRQVFPCPHSSFWFTVSLGTTLFFSLDIGSDEAGKKKEQQEEKKEKEKEEEVEREEKEEEK